MFDKCCFLLFFIFSSVCLAEGFSIDLGSGLRAYTVTQDDVNYPAALYFEIGKKNFKVDQYSFEGSEPIINGMSKIQLGSDTFALVQVRWYVRHHDIKGNFYSSYIYQLKDEQLTLNKIISDDRNLNGFSGYQFDGTVSKYRYETTYDVVNYLKSAYPKGYKLNICKKNEEVTLSCRLENSKVVSLCKKEDSLTYKYGMPGEIEMTYPSDEESLIEVSDYIDSVNIKEFVFNREGYKYSLEYNIGKENINNFKNGYYELRVKHDGKAVFASDCREMLSDVYVSN